MLVTNRHLLVRLYRWVVPRVVVEVSRRDQRRCAHAFEFRFLYYYCYFFIRSRDAKRRDFSVSESIVL